MIPRQNSKDAILDAAEAVVLKSGASHLTLDAVAVKAGVSKGGLLYHFPSKEALLQAMVGRQLERFMQEREAVRAALPSPEESHLQAHVLAATAEHQEPQQLCAALLAALANNPTLLGPVRKFQKSNLKELTQGGLGFEKSALLWLATEGLWFLEMLQVSPLSAAQRKRIAALIVKLSEQWS